MKATSIGQPRFRKFLCPSFTSTSVSVAPFQCLYVTQLWYAWMILCSSCNNTSCTKPSYLIWYLKTIYVDDFYALVLSRVQAMYSFDLYALILDMFWIGLSFPIRKYFPLNFAMCYFYISWANFIWSCVSVYVFNLWLGAGISSSGVYFQASCLLDSPGWGNVRTYFVNAKWPVPCICIECPEASLHVLC